MKKNKGFTLVELLAVIIILGILVTFSTVAISKIKKKQDEENYKNALSSVLTGAKVYTAEHPEILVFDKAKAKETCEESEGIGDNIACTTYLERKAVTVVWLSAKKLYDMGYIDVNSEEFLSLLYDQYNEGITEEKSRIIEISMCPTNKLKLKYRLNDMRKKGEYKYYNDCGCEEQVAGQSKELCTE